MAYDEGDHPRVPSGQPGGGRWIAKSFSSDDEVVDDLVDQINKSYAEYSEFGLRVDDLETVGRAGDSLPQSRIWIDGEPTADFLDGTSTFGIADSSQSDVSRALKGMGLIDGASGNGYFGKVIYLVGGNRASSGEDPGERVIRDAHIIAVYTRDKNAFASIKRRL